MPSAVQRVDGGGLRASGGGPRRKEQIVMDTTQEIVFGHIGLAVNTMLTEIGYPGNQPRDVLTGGLRESHVNIPLIIVMRRGHAPNGSASRAYSQRSGP